ncbi:MAG: hypothetical protein HZA31_00450 [Opitutae bacterium]|nr:hypothetical protein [Opitutae bacterium]
MKHLASLFAILAVALVTGANAQQASLTLKGGNASLAHYNVAAWTLTKTGTFTAGSENPGIGQVDWVVTASRGANSANTLAAFGYVQVQNTGSANATIGNIVVNLQKSSGQGGKNTNWITISSDIANATQGDAATTALISPTASSEGKGSFTENAASGELEFMDAANNTAFSLVPQKSLAAGEIANLAFAARFNNTLLNLAPGTSVRLEIIVTFGNCGPRGGSGAASTNLDINGNGTLSADETYVRSVPTRLTLTVPAPYTVNDSVILVDEEIVKSGTVTLGTLPAALVSSINTSNTANLGVAANGGAAGGNVTNTATLTGSDVTVPVQTGTVTTVDPITLQTIVTPVYTHMLVAVGLHLIATSIVPVPAVEIIAPPPPPVVETYTSFTQGGWGATPNGNNPGTVLTGAFVRVYPAGLTLGNGFTLRFASASAITAFLPAGGPARALTGSLVNPTSSSAGVFGGQVLALRLNVDYSAAGVTAGTGGPLGALRLTGTGTALDGLTVAAILNLAETALGGGGTPAGVTIATLNDIATRLNESYDNGIRGAWAVDHLVK